MRKEWFIPTFLINWCTFSYVTNDEFHNFFHCSWSVDWYISKFLTTFGTFFLIFKFFISQQNFVVFSVRFSCRLVMLLPHGHEGMGPEHTSGQLERFLQLSSDHPDDFQSDFYPAFVLDQLKQTNWQIMNLTTPANFFHAMRRQIAMPIRRPLVIMTPKSLLKLPEARSSLEDMAVGTEFKRIYPDTASSGNPADVTRLIFCSGKVFYELQKEREAKRLTENIAIDRIEQVIWTWCF